MKFSEEKAIIVGDRIRKIGYKMARRRSFGGCGCSDTWHCRE